MVYSYPVWLGIPSSAVNSLIFVSALLADSVNWRSTSGAVGMNR